MNQVEGQSRSRFAGRGGGELRTLAVSLMKDFANDIRWLGSGPRCGPREINLPETQPGSSIMPGKVNPSDCGIRHHGLRPRSSSNDVTITVGGQAANFELIVMLPVMVYKPLAVHRTALDSLNQPVEVHRWASRRTKSVARAASRRAFAMYQRSPGHRLPALAKDAQVRQDRP